MRPSSEKIMKEISDTHYIDAKLKDLSYDHKSHSVLVRYGELNDCEQDCTIIFRDCFSVNINTWLDGMKGNIPQKPGDSDYFFQDITIVDIEINGNILYKCSMLIPMMDCQITCVTIEIN